MTTPPKPLLRLRFDHGTLLLDGAPPGVDLGRIHGVRYDQRVHRFRARACDKDAILRDLARQGFEVVDQTGRLLPAPHGMSSVPLRPYQQAALDAWLSSRRRGVVVIPTGGGKTRVAVAALVTLACRTLILVPTRVLMEQWCAELEKFGIGTIGRWGDRKHHLGAVTVATMDAAWRWMHRIGDAFELIVVDEVHRVASEARLEALEMTIASARLGLTATMPDADATARIERLVGPVVHTSNLDDLAGTFLAPFELVVVATELTRDERETYDRMLSCFQGWADGEKYFDPDLTVEDLVKRASRTPEGRAAMDALRRAKALLAYPAQKRVALARLLVEHRARKILVFTPDNKTTYAIAREHLISPITCEVGRRERARILERFRSGEIRALVSSQVLNEGVDVPDAEVAIIVGGRAGEREHVQRIGRVLRPSAGKQALIFELVVSKSSETRAGARRRAFLGRRASPAPPLPTR